MTSVPEAIWTPDLSDVYNAGLKLRRADAAYQRALKARNLAVAKARTAGASYGQLADALGVSRARVQQMVIVDGVPLDRLGTRRQAKDPNAETPTEVGVSLDGGEDEVPEVVPDGITPSVPEPSPLPKVEDTAQVCARLGCSEPRVRGRFCGPHSRA